MYAKTRCLAIAVAGLLIGSFTPPGRAGVVDLVSVQEFVRVIAQGADNSPTPREQRQDGTGTSFNGNVSITDTVLGPLVTSTQTTSIDLTAPAGGGATFASRGSTVVQNIQASAGGESFFNAVFDVTAPARFTIAYDQSNSERFTATVARFDGPSGLGAIPLGLPAGFGGDLTPGRYTLSADTSSGSQYQLQLVVTPTASAVPLPPQVWTGSALLALLSTGVLLRSSRARTRVSL